MHQLTKHEKKIARVLIDKGADIEFKSALEQVDKVVSAWKQGRLNANTAYQQLYKKIEECEKQIGKRYNGITGGDYLLTVAGIYIDGQITEEDIKDFSEETRAVLNWLKANAEN
ncbi:MAG: hypothetical protein ABI760_01470 [Ferruginibacter sp.]